jgi:hypothetical protein
MSRKFNSFLDNLPLTRKIISVIPALMLIYGFLVILFLTIAFYKEPLSLTFVVLTGIIISMYLIILTRFFNKNPESISISLIGFPNSGKTVFLTVFFNEFLIKKIEKINLRPYGDDTTELVTTNYRKLKQGEWLPSTKPYELFQYRAIASLSRGFFKRSYKILIEDFAGEFTEVFKVDNPVWLHKSPYFKNISQSDIIFFSIDCTDVLEAHNTKNDSKITSLENAFIAAINSIIEQKNVRIGQKLRLPIGLIFMKFDLLTDWTPQNNPSEHFILPERIVKEKYRRLIEYCQLNCSNCKEFYISSVGHVKPNGSPPDNIEPVKVDEPIIWAINNLDTQEFP